MFDQFVVTYVCHLKSYPLFYLLYKHNLYTVYAGFCYVCCVWAVL